VNITGTKITFLNLNKETKMQFCKVTIETPLAPETHWLPSLKQAKKFVADKQKADPSLVSKIEEVEFPTGKKHLLAWLSSQPAEESLPF
jgi:hypothetical protein